MAQLRQDHDKFLSRDAVVIAVGPDRTDQFKAYWEEHDVPFEGLADPRHTVSRVYRQQIKWLKLGRMPAQLIIDKQGIIRYVHYSTSMSDIPENQELLAILDELNAETERGD